MASGGGKLLILQ